MAIVEYHQSQSNLSIGYINQNKKVTFNLDFSLAIVKGRSASALTPSPVLIATVAPFQAWRGSQFYAARRPMLITH